MNANQPQGMEQALARTEMDAAASIRAAQAVAASLRKYQTAAKLGDLKTLRTAVESAEKAMAALRLQITNAKEGWNLDEESYLGSGQYAQELVATAKQAGVSIFERDGQLYCYPALIRIEPAEKSVRLDKKKVSGIRPSVFVNTLKDLQRKPPRFRAEQFLAALQYAYGKAVAMRPKELMEAAPVVPLLEIYGLFTMLPGQSKDYAAPEFARDIYLLQRSGITTTKDGAAVSFPASTGTRTPSRTISVVTETGEYRLYYGIAFTTAKGRV